jgi:hypothetical protein
MLSGCDFFFFCGLLEELKQDRVIKESIKSTKGSIHRNMQYGYSFLYNYNGKTFNITIYFVNYRNGLPTEFQVLINHLTEGFLTFDGEWKVHGTSFQKGCCMISSWLMNWEIF